MSKDHEYLLRIKRETIRIAAERGFDVSREQVMLSPSYTPWHFSTSYFDYARETAQPDEYGECNRVREILFRSGFLNSDRACLSTDYASQADPNSYMIVYFVPSDSAYGKTHKDLIKILNPLILEQRPGQTYQIDCVMIIVEQQLSNPAQDVFKGYPPEVHPLTGLRKDTNTLVQFWLDDELFNPLSHNLTPRHVVLTPEEQTRFFEVNQIQPGQLGRIATNDRVAQRLGLRQNQVVLIEQSSVLSGDLVDRMLNYRITINTNTLIKTASDKLMTQRRNAQKKDDKAKSQRDNV